MDLTNLALAFGSSLTAGFRLYVTVLTLGLLNRYEILDLPQRLEVLSDPWVLGAASVLLIIEFFADKIPYIDNTWDAIHSFIRIPAGALLAAGAMGDVDEPLLWVAGLIGGVISLTAHGAKASTRLAVNATPEPFSNWFLSLLEEDGLSLAAFLVWVRYLALLSFTWLSPTRTLRSYSRYCCFSCVGSLSCSFTGS